MIRAAALLVLATAIAHETVDDESVGMLQVRNAVSRGAESEEMDCALGPCVKPEHKLGQPPAEDVDVEGDDDGSTLTEACNEGTVLKFDSSKVSVNNLGGMGPKKNDAEFIQWDDVGKVDGKSITLTAEATNSQYKDENKDYKMWGFYRAQQFIKRWNGVSSNVGCIASMAPGDFDVTFKFKFEDGSPATVPLLPFVFYDIDGGKESTATNDADNAIIAQETTLSACKAKGYSFCHQAAQSEVDDADVDWDNLSKAQLGASITYIFRNKSKFNVRFSLSNEHRIFMFKGSKTMVCRDQPPYPKVHVQLPSQEKRTE